MRRWGWLLVAGAIWAGCGDNGGADDGGPGTDSGGTDSGPPTDSGPQPDSGPPADGGPGPIDSGTDGGPPMMGCTDAIPALNSVSITSTTFSSPVQVVQPPGSTDLYVVERGGRIRIVRDGTVLMTPFLNVSSLLGGTPSGGSEWGLLSLAFHPDYAANGRFFIGYTPNGGDNTIAEGHRSTGSPDVADATVTTVLAVNDFAGNHNGGLVMFGPDGFLYAGMGDGGGACDPQDNGQDVNELLGKILRIDVNVSGMPYAVPATNPFVGMAGAQGEVWEYGLRNPWRFSFDRATGDLWIGDVGQDDVEEIDVSVGNPGAQNYGWAMYEGATTTGCPSAFCTCSGPLRPGSTHHTPITEYNRAGDSGSVVGGFVYRGSAIPALRGVYLYGDSYQGWVRGMRQCGGAVTRTPTEIPGLMRSGGGTGLVSFGEDNAGEVYLVYLSGQVERIVAP